MKSYRVKFIAMTLAVGILFTSVMAYASTETADVNAYKDYIAMELNAELFDSMGAENGVFPEEYAGAYLIYHRNIEKILSKKAPAICVLKVESQNPPIKEKE